ncbi:hypothetical protein EON79_05035 [bacterium]|nr:MAG: hypothetical protein EON79_05035 [bacterium]
MNLIVTGFGAFGTVTDNPSAILARGCGRECRILEVSYAEAGRFLASTEARLADGLLMLGVAVKRTTITPELFARNHRGKHPDVRGEAPFGEIEPGGPILLSATIWNQNDLADWTEHALVHPSLDAGTFLCNDISYRALRAFPDKPVGFLHVPPFEALHREEQEARLQKILLSIEMRFDHPNL